MVARRRFLGWLAVAPAGLLLTRCTDSERGLTDTLDTLDTNDAFDALDALDANDTTDSLDAEDLGDTAEPLDTSDAFDVSDTSDALDVPDVPRVCTPTRPDALGPYYEEDAPNITELARGLRGDSLAMTGQVLDADCRPIPGALIEVWQADTEGDYHDDKLRASLVADSEGRFAFVSIVPGRYLQSTGFRPAHLHYRVSATGFRTVVTQIYFAGDPYLRPNDSCFTCGSGDADRIVALVERQGRKEGVCDIVLAA